MSYLPCAHYPRYFVQFRQGVHKLQIDFRTTGRSTIRSQYKNTMIMKRKKFWELLSLFNFAYTSQMQSSARPICCGGGGTRTPKGANPAVFKTAALPIRTTPPSEIAQKYTKQQSCRQVFWISRFIRYTCPQRYRHISQGRLCA